MNDYLHINSNDSVLPWLVKTKLYQNDHKTVCTMSCPSLASILPWDTRLCHEVSQL